MDMMRQTLPAGGAYLIKKFFDPDIQKDVWDMIVIRNGELKTKIVRKGYKGLTTTESAILGAKGETTGTVNK